VEDNPTQKQSAPDSDEATSTTAAATEVESSELQRQRDDYYDRLLRKTAEFDNYRKRTERDRQALNEAAAASIMEELLPLIDDLERALKAETGSEGAEAYR